MIQGNILKLRLSFFWFEWLNGVGKQQAVNCLLLVGFASTSLQLETICRLKKRTCQFY
jgi:hypothetical protein